MVNAFCQLSKCSNSVLSEPAASENKTRRTRQTVVFPLSHNTATFGLKCGYILCFFLFLSTLLKKHGKSVDVRYHNQVAHETGPSLAAGWKTRHNATKSMNGDVQKCTRKKKDVESGDKSGSVYWRVRCV